MKIISLTPAAIRIGGVAIALEKDAEVDVPEAKAKHLIKVGLARAVETKTPSGRQAKPNAPAETKTPPADAKSPDTAKADEAK